MSLQQKRVYPQSVNSSLQHEEMHCSINQNSLTPGDVFSHSAKQRVTKHQGGNQNPNHKQGYSKIETLLSKATQHLECSTLLRRLNKNGSCSKHWGREKEELQTDKEFREDIPKRQQGKRRNNFRSRQTRYPEYPCQLTIYFLPFPQHLGDWYLLLIEQKDWLFFVLQTTRISNFGVSRNAYCAGNQQLELRNNEYQ